MRLSFRQGLVSSQADFLQWSQVDNRYVDIVVSPVPVLAVVSSGTKDYLISEQHSVNNAWGPFTQSETKWLYWEINQATGNVTRGSTTLSPIIQQVAPSNPAPGQMWWDSSVNQMKEFNGSRWVNVLRVFAGRVQSGGILVKENPGTQVGLMQPADAGYITKDGLGNAFKNNAGEFLTTETPVASVDTGSLVKLEGAQVLVQANESLPRFSAVYLVNGRAALASSEPPYNLTKAPIALVVSDVYQNDTASLVTTGKVVVNEQWSWAQSDIGKTVYCDAFGAITTTKPNAAKNVRVGTIVGVQSVLLNFDWETDLVATTGNGTIVDVNVISPLTKSGYASLPTIGIPKASSSVSGYLDSADFARIPAVELRLNTKSDVGHTHIIADVNGLQASLDAKANLNHNHVIADVNGLQSALDGKAPILHTHVVAEITDLPPILQSINAQLATKLDKVVNATVGNFVAWGPSGTITDSSFNRFTFALASHTHVIGDVNGLQTALDNKAAIVHAHAISDVTGLQIALDNKADVNHTQAISTVIGLQSALDSKSNVGHLHAISDVNNLQVVLDSKSNVGHLHNIADVVNLQTTLDAKAPLVHTHVIGDVTGLQIALNSKANIVHTHVIADVTDLQPALDAKAPLVHTHVIADVQNLQLELDNKSDITHNHTLDSLSDVDATAKADGQVLTWNNAASKWMPSTVSGGGGGGFTPLVKAWGAQNPGAGPIPQTGEPPNDMWARVALPVSAMQLTPPTGEPDGLPNVNLYTQQFNESYAVTGETTISIDPQPENNGEWLINVRAKLRLAPSDPSQAWNGFVRIWAIADIIDGIVGIETNGTADVIGTYDWNATSQNVNSAVILSYGGDSSFLEHHVNVVWQLATNFQNIRFYITNYLNNTNVPLFVDFSTVRVTKIAPANYI